MKLKFDFSFVDKNLIGKHGTDLASPDQQAINTALTHINHDKANGKMAWADPTNDDELAKIIAYTTKIRQNADSLVVCGIGGSALGSLCCARALLNLNHNELPKKSRHAPKLYVEDNIDVERFYALMQVIDLKNTYFNFVTKSGATTETITQLILIHKILQDKLGNHTNEHIFITTTPNKGAIFNFAHQNAIQVFSIPENIGGRFSVFSAVGLLPLSIMGLDIKSFLRGAERMATVCNSHEFSKNPALASAYIMFDQLKNGKTISVMMPYAESLKYVADFYAQLWGESLAKQFDIYGNRVNSGQTPVKVLGTTDQHSQLQLFCDGPYDKITTFIRVESFRKSLKIPKIPHDTLFGFDYMQNKQLSDVLNSAQSATAFTLATSGRPNFTISIPYVCEYTIGQLLSYFMHQTAFMGAFMQVNAYDQPAVEGVKQATRAILDDTNSDLSQKIRSFNPNPYIIQ